MVAPRIPPRSTSGNSNRRKRRYPSSKKFVGVSKVLIVPLTLATMAIVWNIVRLYHSLRKQPLSAVSKDTIPKNHDTIATATVSWNYDWCKKRTSMFSQRQTQQLSDCVYVLPIDLQDYLPLEAEEPLLEIIPDPLELNDLFELDETNDSPKNDNSNNNPQDQQPLTDDLDGHPDRLGQMLLNPSTYRFPPTPKILSEIRRNMTQQIIPKGISAQQKGSDYYAILSRRGLGDVHTYNQDRAVLVDPYPIQVGAKERLRSSTDIYNDFFMGIWDGHGQTGHVKADYAAKSMPQFLIERLSNLKNKQYTEAQIESAFQDAFWEAHRQGPLIHDSGCTSSVVVRIDQQLYFANTGDSQCMLFTVEENRAVNITYMTKRHKPDDPEERLRITKAGCVVLDPVPFHDPSARVVESLEGPGLALAMSRSLGDYDLEHCGVIPEPTVTSVDLKPYWGTEVVLLTACMTDGLFDYIGLREIADGLAASFFEKKTKQRNVSPLESAAEDLIRTASDRWVANTTFMPYRDDITLVVRRLQ